MATVAAPARFCCHQRVERPSLVIQLLRRAAEVAFRLCVLESDEETARWLDMCATLPLTAHVRRTSGSERTEQEGHGGGHREQVGDRQIIPQPVKPTSPWPQSLCAGRAEPERERTDPPYSRSTATLSSGFGRFSPGQRAGSRFQHTPYVPVLQARPSRAASGLSGRQYPGQIAGEGVAPRNVPGEWGRCT